MSSPWRADFPRIAQGSEIFLDSAATTQKPQCVIDELVSLYTDDYAPVKRGLYSSTEQLTQRYEEARIAVAQYIGAQAVQEICFTRGTTDGINAFMRAWAPGNLRAGDEVVVTALDHHSVILPVREYARTQGAICSMIPITGRTAALDPADIERLITPRTKLVAFPWHSNVRGPLTAEEYTALIDRARAVGAILMIDAAQVPAHNKLSLAHCHADVLVFSSHKLFAPSGGGVLYIASWLHEHLCPATFGGGMVRSVNASSHTYRAFPEALEAGTPSIEAILGLACALSYLEHTVTYAALRAHEQQIMQQLVAGLLRIPGINFIGDPEHIARNGHLVSFTCEGKSADGFHPHDVAAFLDYQGVAVRAGDHCCQPLHQALGIAGSVRASIALYTSAEDIMRLLEALSLLMGSRT